MHLNQPQPIQPDVQSRYMFSGRIFELATWSDWLSFAAKAYPILAGSYGIAVVLGGGDDFAGVISLQDFVSLSIKSTPTIFILIITYSWISIFVYFCPILFEKVIRYESNREYQGASIVHKFNRAFCVFAYGAISSLSVFISVAFLAFMTIFSDEIPSGTFDGKCISYIIAVCWLNYSVYLIAPIIRIRWRVAWAKGLASKIQRMYRFGFPVIGFFLLISIGALSGHDMVTSGGRLAVIRSCENPATGNYGRVILYLADGLLWRSSAGDTLFVTYDCLHTVQMRAHHRPGAMKAPAINASRHSGCDSALETLSGTPAECLQ